MVLKNVLVTGATGILGGWLVQALVQRGDRVVCLVRDGVPSANFHLLGLERRTTVVRGELENLSDLVRALNEYEVEVVYHLGAQPVVGVANRHPLSTFESNIRGTWNVLEACRAHGRLRKVVVASSDKAYGDLDTLPYTEDMPLRGLHPYDCSKACADLLAQSYLKTYGLPVAIARCGNLYGGGDLNWSRVIPGTIRSALAGERPVVRSDGTPLRDYLYVQDAVAGYLALGDGLETGAFNFGTETPTSVLDVVRFVLKVVGSDLEPVVRNEATNEIARQWLSAEKARRRLKWAPAFDLPRGLAETAAWYRTHQDVP